MQDLPDCLDAALHDTTLLACEVDGAERVVEATISALARDTSGKKQGPRRVFRLGGVSRFAFAIHEFGPRKSGDAGMTLIRELSPDDMTAAIEGLLNWGTDGGEFFDVRWGDPGGRGPYKPWGNWIDEAS